MDSSGLKEDIFYSSSWMQEILEISNIGLWLLEINKNYLKTYYNYVMLKF